MLQKVYSDLSPKGRIVFIIAMVIGIIALSDRLLYSPTQGKLKQLNQDIVEEENKIKQNLRLLAYKDQIDEEITQLDSYFAEGVKSEEEVIAAFLNKIERLASASSMTLSKINPSGKEKEDLSLEYFTTIECTGTLENTIGFMHSIESASKLLKVVKYSLSAKASSPDKVQSTMTISQMVISSNPTLTADNLVVVKEGALSGS